MCLYPIRLANKKYTATKKNGGVVPTPPVIGKDEYGYDIYDERVLHVQVPCGQCIECRKQKARNWQVRLQEEIKNWKYKYFVTLTFAPEELRKLLKEENIDIECNAIAGIAVRRCLERYRKQHKKSLQHWLITELGHQNTERIHMHGILMTDNELQFEPSKEKDFYFWKYWKYGMVYVGQYCNSKTVNYIVKYVHKLDEDHKGFVGQVFCSPGIGRSYMEKPGRKQLHRYRPGHTIDFYRLNNGSKVKFPTYYKNKALNEEERELKWRDFMDENKIAILGEEYRTKNLDGVTEDNIVSKAQEYNKAMGYGDNSHEWKKRTYNITKRMLQHQEREKQLEKMRNALKMPTIR